MESLERHREIARLCLLYNSFLNVFNFCNLSLIPPYFSHTTCYFHSFVPNAVYNMWNMLDMTVVSVPYNCYLVHRIFWGHDFSFFCSVHSLLLS